MSNIKAIETHYAGCRFRSRLEARWAVFFDAVGIAWEYEPQGFEVGYRLTLEEGVFPYLPDFWLPGESLWVEVKGSLDVDEAMRLLNAAASLSSNNGGGCHDSGGNDLVVLGPIPPGECWDRSPVRLHMHKGDLTATRWDPIGYAMGGCGIGNPDAVQVAHDYGGAYPFNEKLGPDRVIRLLLKGMWGAPYSPISEMAWNRARKARFEHGERG